MKISQKVSDIWWNFRHSGWKYFRTLLFFAMFLAAVSGFCAGKFLARFDPSAAQGVGDIYNGISPFGNALTIFLGVFVLFDFYANRIYSDWNPFSYLELQMNRSVVVFFTITLVFAAFWAAKGNNAPMMAALLFGLLVVAGVLSAVYTRVFLVKIDRETVRKLIYSNVLPLSPFARKLMMLKELNLFRAYENETECTFANTFALNAKRIGANAAKNMGSRDFGVFILNMADDIYAMITDNKKTANLQKPLYFIGLVFGCSVACFDCRTCLGTAEDYRNKLAELFKSKLCEKDSPTKLRYYYWAITLGRYIASKIYNDPSARDDFVNGILSDSDRTGLPKDIKAIMPKGQGDFEEIIHSPLEDMLTELKSSRYWFYSVINDLFYKL